MGSCDGTKEERIYKIGDRFILFEFYGYDSECGKSHVQITELPKKQMDNCFGGFLDDDSNEIKVKKMPVWMEGHKPIIICAEDFEDTIEVGIENAFEDMWGDLLKEEFDSIPDKLKNKIEKDVTKNILENCKGLD